MKNRLIFPGSTARLGASIGLSFLGFFGGGVLAQVENAPISGPEVTEQRCYRATLSSKSAAVSPTLELSSSVDWTRGFLDFHSVRSIVTGSSQSVPITSSNPTYVTASDGQVAFVIEGTPPSQFPERDSYIVNLSTGEKRPFIAEPAVRALYTTFRNGEYFGGSFNAGPSSGGYRPVLYRLRADVSTLVEEIPLRLPRGRALYGAGIDPTNSRVLISSHPNSMAAAIALENSPTGIAYYSNKVSNRHPTTWVGWNVRIHRRPTDRSLRLVSSDFLLVAGDTGLAVHRYCGPSSRCVEMYDLYRSKHAGAPFAYKSSFTLQELGLPEGAELNVGEKPTSRVLRSWPRKLTPFDDKVGYAPYSLVALSGASNRYRSWIVDLVAEPSVREFTPADLCIDGAPANSTFSRLIRLSGEKLIAEFHQQDRGVTIAPRFVLTPGS
jgi:hypothetical protein